MDATARPFRMLVLLLASLSSWGINTPRDSLNAMQVLLTQAPNCTAAQLKAGTDCCQDCLGMGDLHYNVMHGISFVTAALALTVVGLLIDKFGNSVIILSVACSFSGMSLMSLGSCVPDSAFFLPLMFAGAAIQGLGFMSCQTCRDCIIVTWFSGKELGLALGFATAVNRLSAFGVFCLAEKIRESVSLQVTLWMVAGVSLASLMCAIGVSLLDMRGSRQIGTAETLQQQRKAFSIRDVKEFGLSFWMVAGFNATRLAVDHTMQDNLTEFVHEKFQLTKQMSAIAGGALVYSGFVSAPVAGIILDVTGRPPLCLLVVSALLLVAFGLIAFSPIHPIVTIAFAGFLTCFHYVAVVAAISQVMPTRVLGTALSSIFFLATLCDSLLHLVVGKILGNERSLALELKLARWQTVMYVVLAVLFASLCFAAVNYALTTRPKMPDYQQLKEEENGEKASESIRLQ